MHCTGKHDIGTINIANFACTHFEDKDGASVCKNAVMKGADFFLTTTKGLSLRVQASKRLQCIAIVCFALSVPFNLQPTQEHR
jgi:hypothetical protein